MSDRDNHTTIRVRNEVRDKLKALQQGTHLTLSDVIQNLLDHVEGTVKKDVRNIHRDSVAFTQQYHDFTTGRSDFRDVSFHELKLAEVRDQFCSTDAPSKHSTCEFAEVLFVDDFSVFVRITEIHRDGDHQSQIQEMIHVDLF